MAKRSESPESGLRDAARGVRLHKAMADAGVGSRRACEKLIAEGRVTVNGDLVTEMPAWVDPDADRVEVDGRGIARRRRPGRLYLMVNKPRNVICTNHDPEGRKRVVDLAPHRERLFCVGRLDAESTGMVILTNDGALTEKLTHPRHEVPKTYQVTVKGELTPEAVEKLTRGVVLADREGGAARAKAASVEVKRRDRDSTVLQITLREGRNREIRRMMARLGYRVKKLRRIAIGPVALKGVGSGQWRELSRGEVAALRKAAGRG